MVNPVELRIGNYIEYNSMIMMIDGIQSPRPMKDKRYSNKYLINLFDGAGLITCTLEEINPIPTEEDWMLKLGFEVTNSKHYSKGKLSIQFPVIEQNLYPKGRVYYNSWAIKNEIIKYVHQIQNVYFDLENEELKLKI